MFWLVYLVFYNVHDKWFLVCCSVAEEHHNGREQNLVIDDVEIIALTVGMMVSRKCSKMKRMMALFLVFTVEFPKDEKERLTFENVFPHPMLTPANGWKTCAFPGILLHW